MLGNFKLGFDLFLEIKGLNLKIVLHLEMCISGVTLLQNVLITMFFSNS